jgi:integrase
MRKTPGTGGLLPPRQWKGKDGKFTTSKQWRIWYVDAAGRQHQVRAFTDKRASEEKLSKILKIIDREASGFSVPNANILHSATGKLLEEFLFDKMADGNADREIAKKRTRLNKIFKDGGIAIYKDLTESAVKAYLLGTMRKKLLAKKTRNEYRSLSKQFTAWVTKTYGLPNPLVALSREAGQDGITFERVALDAVQLESLYRGARERGVAEYLRTHPNAGPKRVDQIRLLGLERDVIYRLGSMMGLRVNEIRTLTWGCFTPRNNYIACTIAAEHAKSRRKDTVPVCPELVRTLDSWRELCTAQNGSAPQSFDRVVRVPRHLGEQFRKDCDFVGIRRPEDKKYVLDFYAGTRHSFCTMLGRANVPPHVQRMLMRHKDLATTMIYTHLDTDDLLQGLEAVPLLAHSVRKPELFVNPMLTGACISTHKGANRGVSDVEKTALIGVAAGSLIPSANEGYAPQYTPVQGHAQKTDNVQKWWRRGESNPRP